MSSRGLDATRPLSCAGCGAPIPPGARFCSNCGAEATADARSSQSPFTEAEQLLEDLKRNRAAGRISENEYLVRLAELTVQDGRGTWRFVAGTGEWLWHDGRGWIRRDPHAVSSTVEAAASAVTAVHAIPDGPAAPAPLGQAPEKGRKRLTCFLVTLVSIGLLCACAAVFVWVNAGSLFDFTASTSGHSASSSSGSAPPVVSLSPEQEEIVKEFGWPQSFTIAEVDSGGHGAVRFEAWNYLDAGITYLFADGRVRNWEVTNGVTDRLTAAPYHPDQFALGQGAEEVRAALRAQEWEALEGTGALIEDAELYGTTQVMLAFQDDRLVMVDAVALAPNGGR